MTEDYDDVPYDDVSAEPCRLTKEEELRGELDRAWENYHSLRRNITDYVQALPPMKIKEGMEEKWVRCVENNQDDDYSKAAIEVAAIWARALQPLADHLPEDRTSVVRPVLFMVDEYGLTGFQVDCIVSILRECWEYGELFFPDGRW